MDDLLTGDEAAAACCVVLALVFAALPFAAGLLEWRRRPKMPRPLPPYPPYRRWRPMRGFAVVVRALPLTETPRRRSSGPGGGASGP